MSVSAERALEMLGEGNRRFVRGEAQGRYSAEERGKTLEGQEPWAVIVGCSDSRVPVEAVFDVGVGELFVVRSAGHVLSQAGLASVRFAVEKLGTKLVVVLGHEDCGAVSAALAPDPPAWLGPIIDHIDVSAVDPSHAPHDADDALLAAAVDAHALDTVEELHAWFIENDVPTPPTVVAAAYKLESGEVHWL
ncbi:MAG: carbonic anhydrase [Coriobacteriia bacterium]|nr:carbonic anhydrase [Coriobacteriia bacterium]MBN2821754.1 carbonic anhydrase [Coriobacteriia bacterium]